MKVDEGTPGILHYTAFSADPAGGNPAGGVLDATGLDDTEMSAIAARLGYSESVFLTPPPEGAGGPGRACAVRYFSPVAVGPFCGHATVAAAVALGERTGPGDLVFLTRAGEVPVSVSERDGVLRATLTSVVPYVEDAAAGDVAEALAALDWP
ncbi:PhzF family phenazine biosynthesis isomerase, partial [Streptomyces sp. Act-28]